MAEIRAIRLKNLFDAVLDGKKTITLTNSKLFLESIYEQSSAVTSISCLVSSQYGLEALLSTLSWDTSLDFLNGHFTSFLECIKTPDLQTVQDGDVVRQILAKLLEAPLTWESFVKAAKEHTLSQRAFDAFAWLLVQLLSLPIKKAISYLSVAQDPSIQKALSKSPSYETRTQGRLIAKIAEALAENSGSEELDLKVLQRNPGGRHDNDFAEIHNISIYPTPDELRTKATYLPRPCDIEEKAQESDRLMSHIDCQFRLLREDMLCELREELEIFTRPNQLHRKPLEIWNLSLEGVNCDQRIISWSEDGRPRHSIRSVPWSVTLHRKFGLPQLRGLRQYRERIDYLKTHPNFLRNGSFVCLYVKDEFVTLATMVREEDLLNKSVLCVQLPEWNLRTVLMKLKEASSSIRLVLLSSAIFAYEPVLRQLQNIKELSLSQEIVDWQAGTGISPPDYRLNQDLVKLLQDLQSSNQSTDLRPALDLKDSVYLDTAQAKCFRAALQQKVALIQGPPGTGKSFIGALIGKAIYEASDERILVVCYTHHALDDFLKNLLNLGIPDHDIVRLGSSQKATNVTKSLALREQRSGFTFEEGDLVDDCKLMLEEEEEDLHIAFDQIASLKFSYRDIMEFLNSRSDHQPFYNAFQVPREKYGMIRVAKGGKKVGQYYLLNRWIRGFDAGIYESRLPPQYQAIWNLNSEIRNQKQQQWDHEMSKERAVLFESAGKRYNKVLEAIDSTFLKKDIRVMREKRIIACTTTAAAKFSKALSRISPGVLLVEEAGEILESHVLTALSPKTKQLILIGDHKQLRPKVSFELSVERGKGYDLNRSLFERLILRGFPHQKLFTQHRMRPEISSFIREMTYPELEDAEDTLDRPNLLGFSDNIIFVNHSELETELPAAREFGDLKATTSKQNGFEAKMTLKCVRYLGQQGYKAEDIVVLTPYLGQLRLLLDELSVENNPWLNELDSRDLARAGLMRDRRPTDEAEKPRLRISTIDNFQGEEANIVVASLTRSNVDKDIGFMFAPERLNVLVSRARNALILIGNAEHFMGSRKGSDLWTRFIGLLKAGMHIYDGFPVRCERHPNRTTVLQKPVDFDTECPAGGCKEPCGMMMRRCMHKCPDSCHLLSDNSHLTCSVQIPNQCFKGHSYVVACHLKSSKNCPVCEMEYKVAREEAREKARQEERAKREEQEHLLEMAALEKEIKLVEGQVEQSKNASLQAACNNTAKDEDVTSTQSSRVPSLLNRRTQFGEAKREGFDSRKRTPLCARREDKRNSLKVTGFNNNWKSVGEQCKFNGGARKGCYSAFKPKYDSEESKMNFRRERGLLRYEEALMKLRMKGECQNASMMTELESRTKAMKEKATHTRVANGDPILRPKDEGEFISTLDKRLSNLSDKIEDSLCGRRGRIGGVYDRSKTSKNGRFQRAPRPTHNVAAMKSSLLLSYGTKLEQIEQIWKKRLAEREERRNSSQDSNNE